MIKTDGVVKDCFVRILNSSNGNGSRNGASKPFKLNAEFLGGFHGRKPKFGFGGLGEFVFYRTYSRLKENGTKESFVDTLQRVVEGTYEIQRQHCRKQHIPWTRIKAQASAQEMFQRMWEFKFLPPGRGLWAMGTDFMWERGSAALNNCGFVSTENIDQNPSEPFYFMIDMSMLGVGIGFDTRGAGKLAIRQPRALITVFKIPDSREGWADAAKMLIDSYTCHPEYGTVEYDYSDIRPAGAIINGFGGKASGPGILKRLLEMLRVLFGGIALRPDNTLSSVDIVDVMNMIGKCVVAGNVRRTAEIAFGDPDDLAYCEMKNPLGALRLDERPEFNKVTNTLFLAERYAATTSDFQGCGIDGERLTQAIELWNALCSHRWASNNSIFCKVGMDYRGVAASTAENGEPGYLWLDNIRNYGRMIDGPQPGIDRRAMGSNPCFSGSCRLLTADGYKSMFDLWLSAGSLEYDGLGCRPFERYGSQRIVNRNGLVESTNVYRAGVYQPIWRVTFNDNSWIDATETHNFIILRKRRRRVGNSRKVYYVEERRQLCDLVIGQMIPLNQTQHFGTFDDQVYAELAGWCIGDGSLSPKADGQVRAECTCYAGDVQEVQPRISALLAALYTAHNMSSNQKPSYAGWHRDHNHFEHDEVRTGSNVLGRLLRSDDIKSGSKHKVPNSIWGGTRRTVSAFIRGLASADGGVQTSANGTISVRISQSNKQLLLDSRLLLGQLGIASSVCLRRRASKQLMNDGKGGEKLYNRKAAWDLIISGIKQVKKFLVEVGFIQQNKNTKAEEWLSTHRGSNNSDTGRYVRIKSIEYAGCEDTYCLTEPGDNQVVVEGCQVGQCVEQTLESNELCCLVETFPSHHEDAADYQRTLKFAYLYGKTVTLLPTHNAKTNAVMQRNRRIGLSQSGIIQSFKKFGYRQVLSDFCDKGYKVVSRWDEIYSEWLCVGRSLKKTSVKPSGTVSLVAGTTAGIHYTIAPTRAYWRNVRVSNDDPLLDVLRGAGYHIEPDCKDSRTSVVRFGVHVPDVETVGEIPIWEQVKNASDYQRYWADNQVSCTVQFRREEGPSIAKVLSAFEDHLKGISFLPLEDHGYPQAPYQPATPEEVESYNARVGELDFSHCLTEDAEATKFCDGDKCSVV